MSRNRYTSISFQDYTKAYTAYQAAYILIFANPMRNGYDLGSASGEQSLGRVRVLAGQVTAMMHDARLKGICAVVRFER